MTVTPDRDAACVAIASYLADKLNIRWQGCISQISAHDNVPTDPVSYPHLVVHRTDAEGESLQLCKGIVRYLVLSPTDRDNLPGMFRAMQLAIVELLRNYDDEDFNHQILRPQTFKCRERILGFKSGLIPFFEIEFQFVDFEPLQ